jgi:predicted metal-dependent enzyme (double-stranded beta helix superfamily)
MTNPQRFRDFIAGFSALVDAHASDEPRILAEGGKLLGALVSHDDWLPEEFARAAADSYRQYLLYCDPRERFSVVSFVWGPGQKTPVHDHTVWGLVGCSAARAVRSAARRRPADAAARPAPHQPGGSTASRHRR